MSTSRTDRPNRGLPALPTLPPLLLLVVVATAAAGCGGLLDPRGTPEVATSEQPGPGREAKVVRLSDGDSGWFEIDGREVEVRLLDYNAPERYEGDDRSAPGCNGEAAEAALAQLLGAAASVTVVGDETDRFGRLLVNLFIDGHSAVSTLIEKGRGLSIGEAGPNRDLMRDAAEAGRGMWGAGCGLPAAVGVAVGRVEPDPPGRDEDNLDQERVELVNVGSEAIDLTGWDIRDDTSSHRFDLSGRIEPGDTITIRTGVGSSNEGEIFLGSSTPVWSNRTDTVLVIDPKGVVAAWAFIG